MDPVQFDPTLYDDVLELSTSSSEEASVVQASPKPRSREITLSRSHTSDSTVTEQPPWVRAQARAFLGWMNANLKRRNIQLEDVTEVSQGDPLLNLLEELEKKELFPPSTIQPTEQPHRMRERIQMCLDYFNENNPHKQLVGINAQSIVDLKLDLILGLIWQFILKYAITDSSVARTGDEDTDDIIGLASETVTEALLRWVNEHTPSHLQVLNFTDSFRDGLAIMYLIDDLKPGCIDVPTMSGEKPEDILQGSFDVAEREMDIPQLLEAHFVAQNPDAHSIMTYISFFRQWSRMASAHRGKLDSQAMTIDELQAELSRLHALTENRDRQLKEERQSRLMAEKEYDILYDQFESVKQKYEEAISNPDTKDTHIQLLSQIDEQTLAQSKLKDAYVLARKRLKAAQEAGLNLRDKCSKMELEFKQKELDLQLQLEERRTSSEIATATTANEAHEAKVKGLHAQVDKAKKRKVEVEAALKEALHNLKKERQHREDLAFQVQTLRGNLKKVSDQTVATALFGDTADKSTQTRDFKEKTPRKHHKHKPILKKKVESSSEESSSDEETSKWVCSKCTYHNDMIRESCEMCGTDRNAKKPSRKKSSGIVPVGMEEFYTKGVLDPVKCWIKTEKEVNTKFNRTKNQVVWQFILHDGVHRVMLEHGLTSNKRKISVDAVDVLTEKPGLSSKPAVYHIKVEGLGCKVEIAKKGSHFGYFFYIGDREYYDLRLEALGMKRRGH